MKSISEIKKRIDELRKGIENTRRNAHTDNVLIYSDKMKSMLTDFNEIAHLYWVLEESIPNSIYEMLTTGSMFDPITGDHT